MKSKSEQAEKGLSEAAEDTKDASITAAVKLKLASDEQVSASRIEVETEDGVVSLNGTAASQTVADHAVEVAKSVEDVRTVRSFIRVTSEAEDSDKTTVGEIGNDVKEGVKETGEKIEEGAEKAGSAVKDASITAAVKMKLASDDNVTASNIDVDTKNGVVRLNGTVDSKIEETRAIEIARAVDGVKSVHSNLVVKS
jgi:osmotically-inducible protein OsmY